MTVPPENMSVAIDELESAVAEIESRLESTRAERDEAKARQVELEIENSNLRRELGQAQERQTATAEILKVIASSPSDVQPVFEAIVSSGAKLFEPCTATITTLRDGKLHWDATAASIYGFDVERVRAVYPVPFDPERVPSARAILERRIIAIPDAESSDTPELTRKAVLAGGFRSITFVPLVDQDEGIGTIILTHPEAGFRLSDRQLALVETFADQAVIAIQNARLFNETRDSLERQTATADVLKVIASSPSNVQPVFDAIAVSAKRLLGGFSATVLHFTGDELHLVAFTPGNPAADEGLQASFPRRAAEFPIFALVSGGAAVQFPDTEADDVPAANRDLGRLRGFRGVLFVPLMNRGKAVGIISVTRTEPGPFADHHVQLLQTFADQAVIAIENTRLFNETKEALERQTATADILKVIASSPSDVQPVFDAIASSAKRLIGGFSAAVFRYHDGVAHLAAFTPTDPAADDVIKSSFPRPVADTAFPLTADGQPAQVIDTELAQEQVTREIARARGFRSLLLAPLMNGDVQIGVITVTRAAAGSFADHHVQLLQTFADQAVIAIENARLFNETKEALERQTATAEILKVIASSPSDVQPVFDAIADRANSLIGGFSAAVFRYIDGQIHLAAFTPTDAEGDAALQASFPIPLAEFPPYRLTREGAAAELPDTETEPAAREIARARGYRSMLFAALMNDGEAVGIITVTRVAPGPFDEQHTRLLQMFADQAVIAIKNVGLFNEVQARTRDLEESLEQQTATADVLKVISRSAFDLKTVLDRLIETAVRLGGSQRGGIFFCDGDVLQLQSYYGFPDEQAALLREKPLKIGMETMAGRPALLGETVHIPDILLDQDFKNFAGQAVGKFRAFLGVPLKRDGTTFGVLGMNRPEPGPFSPRQIELVQTFADQAVIAIENVRLFDEVQAKTRDLEASLKQQTAVGDVLKTISRSTFDLQPVLDTLVNTAAILCGADMAFIMRREGDEYRAGAAVGYTEAYIDFLTNHPLAVNRGTVTGRAVLERHPVQILDVMADPEYTLHETYRLAGQRTTVGVPLLRENEPIGVIVLARQRVEAFTENQIELVTTFADQAVIAIENVRLFNETREALERQTATSDILKVIASSPSDVQPVFDVIVERAVQLCGARMGRVYRYDGELIHMVSGHGLSVPGREGAERPFPRPASDDTIVGGVMLSRQPTILADLDEDDSVPPLSRQMIAAIGARSQVTMPMLLKGEPIGAITLSWAEPHGYTDHQIELLRTFADQAVIAIENTRLFNEVQQRTEDLSEALQHQTATADVLKVISRSAFDLETVLDALLSSACRLCQADIGTIRYREGSEFQLAATFGAKPDWVEHFRRYTTKPDRSSVFGRTILEGHTIHIPDLLADPDYNRPEAQKLMGFRAALGVPLTREGETFGVINLFRFNTGPFEDRQIELVQTFADQAVIAIENVRLFDEVQAKTRDLEEALTYQTGSANILRVIASSPTDVNPVLTAIVESACELCGAYDSVALLKEGDQLRFSAHHGPIPLNVEKWPINRNWVSGRAFVDQKPVHVTDLMAEGEEFPDGRELSARMGHRTMVAVPLLREGESIGALILRRQEVNPFSDKQIALLQTFADQAVIAIGNVHLFDEVQAKTRDLSEALTYQTGSANILKVIASSPTDIKPVLDAIVESACELCGAYDAVLRLKKGDQLELGAHHGTVPADWNLSEINPFWTAGRAVLDQRPVHVHDMSSSEGDEFPQAQARALDQGHRTILSVPLLQEGNSVGSLTLRRLEVNPFTDKQIALLQTFADQAVIAIGNVRLFEEVQAKTRELGESLQQQTATADVLKVISRSAFDLQTVLETLIRSAVELSGAYRGSIFLREGDVFPLKAASSTTPEFLAYWAANPPRAGRGSATSRVIMSGQVEIIPDVLEDPEMEMPPGSLVNIRATLGVPMLRDNKVEGVLVLTRPEPGPFTRSQIDLVQTFADQAVIAVGNVRLFEEVQAKTRDLEEALTYQTGSANILKVIASSPTESGPALKAIVESACELCEANDAHVALRDGDDLVFKAQHGSIPIVWDRIPINRRMVTGRAIIDGTPIHIRDLNGPEGEGFPDARQFARRTNVRSLLSVPLLREGNSIGVITLRRQEVNPFTDKQIALLQTFADQAVIAIGNVHLFEEVQARTRDLTESLQQQTATADVLKVISRSAFDLKTVLDTLIESAVTLGAGARGGIFFTDGDVLQLQSYFGFTDDHVAHLREHPIPISMETMAGRPALLGHTVHIPDILADADFKNYPALAVGKFRAFLGVPLKRDGTIFGVLGMNRPEPRPFTQRQIELVETFADQAVIAIENARLFEQVQQRTRELSESLQQQTATADVLKVISRSAFDLPTVLDTLVQSATHLCDADEGTIFQPKDDAYRLTAACGLSPTRRKFFEDHVFRPGTDTVTGRVLAETRTIHVEDYDADPSFRLVDPEPVRTRLGVPLLREGAPIGVFVLARRQMRPFSAKQIELVQTFADQAVIAIENARLFEEVQQRTRELTESLQQQTATSEVLQVISSSPGDLAPVFDKMLENAIRVCGAEFGSMNLVDNGAMRPAAQHNVPAEYAAARGDQVFTPHPTSPLATAIRTKQVVHWADLRTTESYVERYPAAVQLVELAGARTVAIVPMLRDDEAIGAITIFRKEVQLFSDKQIELLSNFARQAVIAIENARLLKELRQRTEDLSKSLDDLRTAQDRLIQTEKLASLGQLTAGIAHEIKNPLNFVNNFAALSAELTEELNEALKQAEIGETLRAEVDELTSLLKGNLEKVVQHGKRADSIVKNMLLHSREGSGEHRPSDINALIEESLNLAYHGARAERPDFNVTLERDFDTEAGQVHLFPQEVTRVILNLVSNGFYAVTKRRKEGSEAGFEPMLRASTKNLGEAVEIRIRDNGTGIPAEVKEKMFNPFFTTKPAGEGTGLGLSMSYDIIVKQHGGTIDVDTSPGHFTEFRIVLPRTSNFADKSRG